MKPFHILFYFIILLSTVNLKAQDTPIEWGEIPLEDLKMTSFPSDTNASAVILCDYGESYYNDDLNIVFNRTIRIKIFNPKGYNLAEFAITLYTKDRTESLDEIEGITYNLKGEDEIEETELDEDDIFEEEYNTNFTRYKFTMPALSPGCIVEVRYTTISESFWFMNDWVFQYSEPVRWSEYRVRSPRNISYSFVHNGYEQFYINEVNEVSQVFSGNAAARLGSSIVKCNQIRYVLKDAPAVRDEPFITTVDDYKNKVDAQLAGFGFVSYPFKQVLRDWDSFVDELLENKNFGDKIDDSRTVTKLVEQVTDGILDPEAKIKAVYDWVVKNIVWNERQSMATGIEPDDLLDKKSGNSAEINTLLISMLKSLDIEAHPVILSTRANGKLQKLYPIMNQFNYVITRAKAAGKYFYLDATDAFRPYYLLPAKVLGCEGLLIKEKNYEWIRLSSDKKFNTSVVTNTQLQPDGSLKGSFEALYTDYAGLSRRKGIKNAEKLEDYVKDEFDSEDAEFIYSNISVTAMDSLDAPLRIKSDHISPSYANNTGDIIYFNPTIIKTLDENPLKANTRKFPLDYNYRQSFTGVTNITIPDDYSVKEAIKNYNISAAGGGAVYSRQHIVQGNTIQILIKYEIKQTEFSAQMYQQLREFYSKILAAEAEQFVLGKNNLNNTVPASNTEN